MAWFYICFGLHMSHVYPYEFYNGLVMMGLGLRALHEELGWLSTTALRNQVLHLIVQQG
jgi:hypothetical protein